MKVRILADADSAAKEATSIIASEAANAIAARGIFTLAVSGGKTPWLMLRYLSTMNLPWKSVHLFQVDERVAPAGDPDRNLTRIQEILNGSQFNSDHLHAMPVESGDMQGAAAEYAGTLRRIAGDPPVLDVAHLGLGSDGHTASLVPGDPVLDVKSDVGVTGVYQGRSRMTLTYPILNRSRLILWLATGAEKQQMLSRLQQGDATIPAGRIRAENAVMICDSAAATGIDR